MPPLKNATLWQPQTVKGTVVNIGQAFLVDKSGNFLVDNSGNFLVSTATYVAPLNATTWTEAPAK